MQGSKISQNIFGFKMQTLQFRYINYYSKDTQEGKISKNSLFAAAPFSANQPYSQPAITCSKLTVETLEQVLKYAQS